jgi:hypothetical protein
MSTKSVGLTVIRRGALDYCINKLASPLAAVFPGTISTKPEKKVKFPMRLIRHHDMNIYIKRGENSSNS